MTFLLTAVTLSILSLALPTQSSTVPPESILLPAPLAPSDVGPANFTLTNQYQPLGVSSYNILQRTTFGGANNNLKDTLQPMMLGTSINSLKNLSGHLALLHNPVGHWKIICPGCDQPNGCTGVWETTSRQARSPSLPRQQQHTQTSSRRGGEEKRKYSCSYATNAGPFNMAEHRCIGPIVSNGVVASKSGAADSAVCMGLLKNKTWWIGTNKFLQDRGDSLLSEMEDMNCGFQWLVFNGEIVQPEVLASQALIAGRTVFGLNSRGEFYSLVIEGIQDLNIGVNILQTAQWVKNLVPDMIYAVNMDGGGSSTAWSRAEWVRDPANDGVIGCPCGFDLPVCSERSVIQVNCFADILEK